MTPYLRPFTPDDWQAYQAIRLEALLLEGQYFGSHYADEALRTKDDWRALLDKDNWIVWGLYDGDHCIGLTGVIRDGDYAKFIASYIRKEYRRQGLSAVLYQERIEWSRAQGFKSAKIWSRDSNAASIAANQKFGFRYSHSEEKQWIDGMGTIHCYIREL